MYFFWTSWRGNKIFLRGTWARVSQSGGSLLFSGAWSSETLVSYHNTILIEFSL